jgi:hypothetical protein
MIVAKYSYNFSRLVTLMGDERLQVLKRINSLRGCVTGNSNKE